MAHSIWSGAITFGLVTIPVKLQTAIKTNDLRFNFLHKKDHGRVNNVRRCSIDGEELAFGDIERGYEYEKGKYVVLTDDDFARVNPKATESVDIVQFVQLSEIDPMLFDKAYYLEPDKRGRHAYALLREALKDSGKVGIAKVVIRSREHLAAVKPSGDALMLEMMHFADELVDASEYDFPASETPSASEMKMAKLLVDTMTEPFDPSAFRDTYREEITTMIEARANGDEVPAGEPAPKRADNVIDLMAVLQKSLEAKKAARGASAGAERASAEPAPAKPAPAERARAKAGTMPAEPPAEADAPKKAPRRKRSAA